jgi:hypothetical protein
MTDWPVNQRQDTGPSWGAEPTDRTASKFLETIQIDGKPLEIFKNPSRKEMQELTEYDEVRGFLVGNDLYVWTPMTAIHAQVAEKIGIGDDHVWLNMVVQQDGKCSAVMVSDWTQARSRWYHNPKIKEYILNHPALKLVRDRSSEFEILYFDQNIVGDWAEMGSREAVAADDPLKQHRKTKPYKKTPEYVFEKEVYNDWQSCIPGSDKHWRDIGKHRSGYAYWNLPARIELFVERHGEPDWVYTLSQKGSNALHAVYFQKGKDLIQIWNRGNILSEYPWKEFERQAQAHGLKPQHFHRGEIDDGKGYWLKQDE